LGLEKDCSRADAHCLSGTYLSRIRKGEKLADLPVQRKHPVKTTG